MYWRDVKLMSWKFSGLMLKRRIALMQHSEIFSCIRHRGVAMIRQRGKGYAVCIKGLPTLRFRRGTELPLSGDLQGIAIESGAAGGCG